MCINMVTSIYDCFLKALSFVPEDFINENITLQQSLVESLSGMCGPGKSMDIFGPQLSLV